MSGSLNKVQIIGNLGFDPEVRYTGDNRPIANLRVATTEKWKDRNSGEQQEKTEWHRIVIFGPLAEVAQKYLHKGDSAYFEGKLQTRKWTDKEGQERYSTEVVVDRGGSMQMLGGRGQGVSSGSGDDYSMNQSSNYDTANDNQAAPSNNGPAMKPKQVSDDAAFDDDIPF